MTVGRIPLSPPDKSFDFNVVELNSRSTFSSHLSTVKCLQTGVFVRFLFRARPNFNLLETVTLYLAN
jgi:hypothetical protein